MGVLEALMYITHLRGVIFYYNFLLSTNIMAIENFKVEVDVQIIVLKFKENFDNICAYLYDLNNHM